MKQGSEPYVEVIVEIPSGSRNKYEVDQEHGVIRLDRVLYSSVHYPGDYGFIPNTMSADGDPLDALVLVQEPTFPGCHIKARPIGVLMMKDEKGVDEKILAVPTGDPRFEGILDIGDLRPHWLAEIENFFTIYKMLEKKEILVEGWEHVEKAKEVIQKYSIGSKAA